MHLSFVFHQAFLPSDLLDDVSLSHSPNVPPSLPPSLPQRMEHKGIRFWCYNAGHVLGAAMFMIEIGGLRVLYTGDYSMEDDR